jgi:hypothetical protein
LAVCGRAGLAACSGEPQARWNFFVRFPACPGSSPTSCPAGWADLTLAADFFVFSGLVLGGCRCQTRADTTISSFSAKGAIRHQPRGSAMYRTCELTSSGNRLFSMTGLVVSQVRTPGGRT